MTMYDTLSSGAPYLLCYDSQMVGSSLFGIFKVFKLKFKKTMSKRKRDSSVRDDEFITELNKKNNKKTFSIVVVIQNVKKRKNR